jgi:hypothetical protein
MFVVPCGSAVARNAQDKISQKNENQKESKIQGIWSGTVTSRQGYCARLRVLNRKV